MSSFISTSIFIPFGLWSACDNWSNLATIISCWLVMSSLLTDDSSPPAAVLCHFSVSTGISSYCKWADCRLARKCFISLLTGLKLEIIPLLFLCFSFSIRKPMSMFNSGLLNCLLAGAGPMLNLLCFSFLRVWLSDRCWKSCNLFSACYFFNFSPHGV